MGENYKEIESLRKRIAELEALDRMFKKTEEEIAQLTECVLRFSADIGRNIQLIIESAGKMFDGTCALYNRYYEPLLCSVGKWQAPQDMPEKDDAEGHLCFDVIKSDADPLIVKNLDNSIYYQTDPNVKKYNLKTYIGSAVRINGKPKGSLCVVFNYDKDFMPNEIEFLSILARLLGIEEERRMAERMVFTSEVKYRQLFENMQSGVAIYEAVNNGEDFIVKDFNKAAERIDKIARDEVVGESVLKVFPGVKEFGLFEIFQKVFRTGVPEYFPLFQYKDSRISGWRESYVYKLPSGEVISIYDDVTSRKTAEDELKKAEETYRALVDNITIGVALINPEMNLMAVNKKMQEWFPGIDTTKKSVCFEVFNDPPRTEICPYCPTCKTLKDGLMHEVVTETVRGGKVVNFRVMSSAVRDASGGIIAAIEMMEEVTESKALQDELHQKIEQLERFHKIAVGRELKMRELKDKVMEMEEALRKTKERT